MLFRFSSIIFELKNISVTKDYFRHYSTKIIQAHNNMAAWQKENKQFLSMSLNEKRTLYKCKKYIKTEEIPTWSQYAEKHSPLPTKVPILSTNQINTSQNSELTNKISVLRGDITTLELDVIVNAANKRLLGGGGVDGAIHSAAGPFLKEECKTLNGCEEGEAKLTGGYKLPAKYVIHTVGPQSEKPEQLSKCYKNSLNIMKAHNFRTIAFPCISTGIYGYPLIAAAHVATMEVRRHLESYGDSVDRVVFCLFSEEDEQIYQSILQSYFPLK